MDLPYTNPQELVNSNSSNWRHQDYHCVIHRSLPYGDSMVPIRKFIKELPNPNPNPNPNPVYLTLTLTLCKELYDIRTMDRVKVVIATRDPTITLRSKLNNQEASLQPCENRLSAPPCWETY